jgi:hypothetical protein
MISTRISGRMLSGFTSVLKGLVSLLALLAPIATLASKLFSTKGGRGPSLVLSDPERLPSGILWRVQARQGTRQALRLTWSSPQAGSLWLEMLGDRQADSGPHPMTSISVTSDETSEGQEG